MRIRAIIQQRERGWKPFFPHPLVALTHPLKQTKTDDGVHTSGVDSTKKKKGLKSLLVFTLPVSVQRLHVGKETHPKISPEDIFFPDIEKPISSMMSIFSEKWILSHAWVTT